MPVVIHHYGAGVYLITNTVNGKVYVGSATKSIKRRWFRHRVLLRGNRHHNLYLQNSWNKYGEMVFEFKVAINCASNECVKYEQLLIERYNSADRKFGYNVSPTAGNCLGTVHTDETRERMSMAHKGKKKTSEHIAKVAAANRGLKRSAETRAKISAARKGKKLSASTIEKIIASNTDKRLSDEHREKLSTAARQRDPECYTKGWETRRLNKGVR